MRAQWIAACGFALLFGFALVLLRGEPVVGGDQGVFLSVAARMLEGDRLYSEVFDNKDPLFFYTYAAGLGLAGWRGAYLLDAVWLALGAVGMALLLTQLRAPRSAVVAGLVVYPLALTAGWYLVGMSMLGGLAVAPFVAWLWLRASFYAAGAGLAVVLLLKFNLAPLAAAPLGALLVLGAPEEQPRGRALLRTILGFGGGLAATALVLAGRGELRSYVEAIQHNVHYSKARTVSESFIGRTEEHGRIAWDFFYLAGRWQVPLGLLVLGTFAGAVLLAVWRGARSERVLGGLGVAALLGAGAVIALTAYGEEHLQLLAYPATLVAAALVWRTDALFGTRAGLVAAAVVAAFSLWTSLKAAGGTEVSGLWSEGEPHSGGAVVLERTRSRLGGEGRTIPYMVFGSNSENGHAAFLDSGFELKCRYFHLYEFSRREQFDETIECARRERPQLVLVTLGFFDERSRQSTPWGTFVRDARRLLRTDYENVDEEHPGFQAWKRLPAS